MRLDAAGGYDLRAEVMTHILERNVELAHAIQGEIVTTAVARNEKLSRAVEEASTAHLEPVFSTLYPEAEAPLERSA